MPRLATVQPEDCQCTDCKILREVDQAIAEDRVMVPPGVCPDCADEDPECEYTPDKAILYAMAGDSRYSEDVQRAFDLVDLFDNLIIGVA